jgi:hypothetical protein
MVFRPSLALKNSLLTIWALLAVYGTAVQAQTLPERKRVLLEIPALTAIAASELHFYALSVTDGLVVFRIHQDSLAFLYKSEGMQRRGTNLLADARFAYILKENMVSVVEPTSMLGVFSSTKLPGQVRTVVRSGMSLFAAIQGFGIGALSLSSPDAFDSAPRNIYPLPAGVEVFDLLKQGNSLLALTSEPSVMWLSTVNDSTVSMERKYTLDRNLTGLIVLDQSLAGFDASGNLYQIAQTGKTTPRYSFKEPVDRAAISENLSVLRTRSGSLWVLNSDGTTQPFRTSGAAGNFIAAARGQLWMAENNTISEYSTGLTNRTQIAGNPAVRVTLKPIPASVVSYPRPYLGVAELETGDIQQVRFFARSATATGIEMRGNGLYWQPASRDVGRHYITVFAVHAGGASDSVRFTIDVRPFNAPPRFTPILPQTIIAGFAFELPVKAVDPDGNAPDLIRYLGVNLPEGASLDEKTGVFSWKPSEKHTGTHQFRVVASDQFGAAAALEIQLTVQTKQ